MKPKKSTHPLAARVKKMMQADDDIGKIAQATPVLVGRATELFVRHLMEKAVALASSRNACSVTPAHLKAAVCDEDMLDFLKGIVEGIPDLGPEEEAPPPDTKPKRRSRKADGEEGSPAKRSRKATAKAGAKEGKPDMSEAPVPSAATGEVQLKAEPPELEAGGAPEQAAQAAATDPAEVKPEAGSQPQPKPEPAAEQEIHEQQPPATEHPGPPLAVPGVIFPLAASAVPEEDDYDAEE
ncbi:g6534 [Coccomyxa viridis]|uniref:G6534 protein n=1 Tax=Coccomyxa viridis TaxID=1274662 RepID=A0ABP1FWU9_9CHLO